MTTTYLKPSNLYGEAARRLEELEKLKAVKERAMQKAPAGKIHCVRHGKQVQYYLRQNASDIGGTYLRKSEQIKVPRYLQKSYDEKVLRCLNREICGLKRLLHTLCGVDSYSGGGDTNFGKTETSIQNPVVKLREIWESFPESSRAQIAADDVTDEAYISEWLNIPYEGKNVDQNLPFRSERGEVMRSKSEVMIANTLDRLGIPYKYECPLRLASGVIIHPDFTILDVVHRRVLYWEHCGRMDDSDYARDAIDRIKDYEKTGLYPGRNLILTFETKKSPLGTDEIKETIRAWGLRSFVV